MNKEKSKIKPEGFEQTENFTSVYRMFAFEMNLMVF